MTFATDDKPFTGLRALAGCGGCAAKAPPELVALLANVAAAANGNDAAVLAGLAPADDAAVYALDSQRALVATVDFFPPLVDDPPDYGTIAAANAVSDIYAMGGSVAFALAVSGFPTIVPSSVIAEVNRAAAAVVTACGGSVLGGHSIRCAEPIFGLCVFGFVHPERVWRKAGAQPGDVLMLSKPLGTGVLLSSRIDASVATAIGAMRTTNLAAATALHELVEPPHAVTDVSGYGLLGHAREMAEQSAVTLRIDVACVPLLPGALAAAEAGVRTSQHSHAVAIATTATAAISALLNDPQTSGGLLVSVSPAAVPALVAAGFANIGQVLAGPAKVVAG